MRKTVTLNKPVGETPLETLSKWRKAHPHYRDVPASYAGRLDPMASGKLLILLGDACKNQERYTKLDKEYVIEVLLDVGSDTGDVLGIVHRADSETKPSTHGLKAALSHEIGTKLVPYPVYSSKTVAGKPLFLYALEGTLATIEIPTHEETVYSIRPMGMCVLTSEKLRTRVESLLARAPVSTEPSKALGADFRIKDVKRAWHEVLAAQRTYTILRLRVSCASGTYMRSLVGRIGERLGTKALALSIHRTRIGRGWFAR